jgi:hypothetical protein
VPIGAQFCPHCGNDLRAFKQLQPERNVAAAPINIPGAAPLVTSKNNRSVWVVLALAGLVGLAFLGFLAMSLLKQTAQVDTPPILAKTGSDKPILQQTAREAPVLATTKEAPVGMPDDVRRWLEHLEAIEKRRAKLAQSGLASLMMLAPQAQAGMDLEGLKALAGGDPEADMPKNSADKVKDSSAQTKAEWRDLRVAFDAKVPPVECKIIADSYTHSIDETGAMIGDILDAVSQSSEDTQGALAKLYGMQNQSKSIDEFGKETDGKVADICDKYKTRKWFSISADFGNTSLFSSFGGK